MTQWLRTLPDDISGTDMDSIIFCLPSLPIVVVNLVVVVGSSSKRFNGTHLDGGQVILDYFLYNTC